MCNNNTIRIEVRNHAVIKRGLLRTSCLRHCDPAMASGFPFQGIHRQRLHAGTPSTTHVPSQARLPQEVRSRVNEHDGEPASSAQPDFDSRVETEFGRISRFTLSDFTPVLPLTRHVFSCVSC